MSNKGFCQKDNKKVSLDNGCLHPNDYCQYRQSCLVHYFEQEKKREKRKRKNNEDIINK